MTDFLKRNLDFLSRITILLIIVLSLAVFNTEAFLNASNLSTVVFQQAPFTILMSFGMTMAIITKGIDKSMASVVVLASMLSGGYFKNGNMLVGLAIALAVGAVIGLVNGLLITRIGVASFIATYGTDFIALGLAYGVAAGEYIYDFPASFREITNGYLIPGIPNIAVITLIIFILLWFLTRKTIFGRSMYCAGFNFNATVLSGIDAKTTITIVYILNGIIAAFVGVLYMSRLNAADPNISGNLCLDSIAASLIGGTSFGGGKGNVANAVVGALIIVFIRNGMNIMSISTNWQQTVVGLVIIFSVFYEMLINKIAKGLNKTLV